MGQLHEAIDTQLRDFLLAQHVFFVATAPASGGHVNVSPKGLDSVCVLGPREIAYLDLVGSGAETIAHVRENGRITLMFCAFDGPPKIVRLYGRGRVVEPADAEFTALRARFATPTHARAVLVVELERIADSCGFGVPRMRFEGERTELVESARRKGAEGLREYQRRKNQTSLDGLPALRWTEEG